MSSLLERIPEPLRRRIKLRLAGDDVDELVANRHRRRLRWLAREADDPVLRFRALRCLSELLDPDAAGLFMELCDAEPGLLPTPTVRTAADGLGRLLHGDSDACLRRLLANDRPACVQLAAARALASIGRPRDWVAVRGWAVRCEEAPLAPDHRDSTAPTRSEPPGLTSVLPVLETLYADKDATWWTSKAARWLESDDDAPRMASNRGAAKIVAQAHRNGLQRGGLSDEEFRRTVLHLGTLARERDHDLLTGLVTQQDDAERRRAVVQALGLQADLRSAPLLRAWLGEVPDGDSELARDLVRAVGRLGSADLVPELISVRRRFTDPGLHVEVAWALGECCGPDAVAFAIELVRDRDEDLSDDELGWLARSLRRCGVPGREAIRGSVAIARAGGGERNRVKRVAEIAGIH